jgi:hypothetical protein
MCLSFYMLSCDALILTPVSPFQLLSGTPASNALIRPKIGVQLIRINGKLLPALIDSHKLMLLLAQQCYCSDTIVLSFRTDSLDEYTSVINVPDDEKSPEKRAQSLLAEHPHPHKTRPDAPLSFSDDTSFSNSRKHTFPASSPSPERERDLAREQQQTSFEPIGREQTRAKERENSISSTSARPLHHPTANKPTSADASTQELGLSADRTLATFLDQMRLELNRCGKE